VLTDPKNWRVVSPAIYTVYVDCLGAKGQGKRIFGQAHRFPASMSPLRLYSYLRHRFGKPNGFMTFMREDSVDNLIQWDYFLEDETFLIELLGLNYRLECRLWAFAPFPEPEWLEFDQLLSDEIAANDRHVGDTIAKFEKWQLIVNPYKRLEIVGNELKDRLTEFKNQQQNILEYPLKSKEFERYHEQLNQIHKKLLEMTVYATVLQSIAPVLAEAAVNLLITITAREEIRKDSRLLEDCLRRNIDVRVKRLHIDCTGFVRALDQSKAEFKDFLRLMGRRNDSLHGNIDTKQRIGDYIYFDLRTIPLVETQKSLMQTGFDHITAGTSIDGALQDLEVAEHFVNFILAHLDEDHRKQIRPLFDEKYIGFRPSTSTFGVILPRAFVDMFLEAADGTLIPGTATGWSRGTAVAAQKPSEETG
jgi:hypothetical protein